jgi:hypothetical protein
MNQSNKKHGDKDQKKDKEEKKDMQKPSKINPLPILEFKKSSREEIIERLKNQGYNPAPIEFFLNMVPSFDQKLVSLQKVFIGKLIFQVNRINTQTDYDELKRRNLIDKPLKVDQVPKINVKPAKELASVLKNKDLSTENIKKISDLSGDLMAYANNNWKDGQYKDLMSSAFRIREYSFALFYLENLRLYLSNCDFQGFLNYVDHIKKTNAAKLFLGGQDSHGIIYPMDKSFEEVLRYVTVFSEKD